MYFSPDLARTEIQLAYLGGLAESVGVTWRSVVGGTRNGVTGEYEGGTATVRTGTLRAFGLEEPARAVTRQFAEIQTGDLLLDLPPEAVIELADGSTVELTAVAQWQPRFQWGGREYVQKELGTELRTAWVARAGGVDLGQTILLRPAT